MLRSLGSWLCALIGKREVESEEVRARKAKIGEGVGHFMEGHAHFLGQRDEEALECFDRAIDCGFEHHELYEERAMCLQRADYDLDAIEDFGKAIGAQPQDCNLYFMRSLSLRAVCRLAEAAKDLQEAIRLSKIENTRNAVYHSYAAEKGHPSATSLYEWYLAMNQVDLEMSDAARQLRLARLQIKRRARK